MDYKGTWIFSKNKDSKIQNDDKLSRHFDLFKMVMDIFFKRKLILPKKINSVDIQVNTTNEFMRETLRIAGSDHMVSVTGDTIIHTNDGDETHSDIFHIDFVAYGATNDIYIASYSEAFLPLIFNWEDYDFEWNLERYNLNRHRIEKALQEIELALGWKNTSKYEADHYEMNVLQLGYKTFIEADTIKEKYEEEPPSEPFDLDKYLQEIKEARALSDQYYEELRKKNDGGK